MIHTDTPNLQYSQSYTYDDAPRRPRRKRKKKYARRILKCAFTVSLFALSFAAGAGFHVIKSQINSWHEFSATTFLSDTESGQTQSTADSLPQEPEAGSTGRQMEIVHITAVSGQWNLILVNPWNPIPQDYDVNLIQVQYGHSVDSRCYPYLAEMLEDCKSAGLNPLICSSYRTQEKQEALFAERVSELTAQGYSYEDARTKAATSVALPGTSEHQLGLAVDIVDKNYQKLDTAQENTQVQQWLMENSWKYGFILRYPNGTSSLTGIIYEPWHYRYVGLEAAQEIYEQGICLEEYLAEEL